MQLFSRRKKKRCAGKGSQAAKEKRGHSDPESEDVLYYYNGPPVSCGRIVLATTAGRGTSSLVLAIQTRDLIYAAVPYPAGRSIQELLAYPRFGLCAQKLRAEFEDRDVCRLEWRDEGLVLTERAHRIAADLLPGSPPAATSPSA